MTQHSAGGWTAARRNSSSPWHAPGFTIIELMVVLAILAILATMAMPLAEVAHKRSKERELKAALWEIRGALDRYKQAYDEERIAPRAGASGYPRTLDDLVATSLDAKTGAPMHFLRRVPRDPFVAPDFAGDAHGWGVRAYAAPADQPRPGDDVYDVYSLAAGNGVNGIPYAKW
jgi:general secretion pathway protein G